MNNYKGLFTFDVDNHRYISVEQADGLISDMFYHPEENEDDKGSALDLMIMTLINFIQNEPDEDKVDLEDCKQMLEKLKALRRLKEKGFKFDGWFTKILGGLQINVKFDEYNGISPEDKADLDLLFGGE